MSAAPATRLYDSDSGGMADLGRDLGICGVLAAAVWAIYGQAIGFEFVRFDDYTFLLQNANVTAGLTADGIAWAFTTPETGNWHPLSWLSHMASFALFGDEPAGHHALNVVLHMLNTLLLFGVLRAATDDVWPSSFVAALFAVHPLHVESVAWVSERKDVLSLFFGLLSTWAYVAYARRGRRDLYWLAALLLAFALMSKAMLVTLPLVFLLLDYWPLRRMGPVRPTSVARSLLEKVPLLALSAISALLTLVGAVRWQTLEPVVTLSLQDRLANAGVAYVWYMRKMIWPGELAALYPHPSLPGSGGAALSPWHLALAVLALAAVSAWALRRKRPGYVPVGWLWYLGTLVPVIGLVQVGNQAVADRYAYLPLIGLFVIAAWAGRDRMSSMRSAWARRSGIAVAVLLLTAHGVVARQQAGYWRNSVTLFERAHEISPRSSVVSLDLGNLRQGAGRLDEAIILYRRALEVDPGLGNAHYNLAHSLVLRGEPGDAAHHYREAIRIGAVPAAAHYELGWVLEAQGRSDEAIEQYREALRILPDFPAAAAALAEAEAHSSPSR